MTAAEAITVIVDGRPRTLDRAHTLADLVSQLGHAQADVATSVNGSFVARASRGTHSLAPGDSVLIFKPIVGG